MKKLTGLILILAVFILGGYYGMGILTEKTLKKNLAEMNQTNGLFAQIEHYNRHWFTSDAQIKWRVLVPERIVTGSDGKSQTVAAQNYQIDMPVKIYHGPFIYANNKLRFGMGFTETELTLPEQYSQKIDQEFTKESTKPKFNLSIFINYLNKCTMEFLVPSFKLINKDNKGFVEWNGMQIKTKMSSNRDKLEGDIVVDGMKASKDDSTTTLGKMSADFDLHQTTSGLFLGNANFTLPFFDVVIKNKKMFEITDYVMNSDSDIQDNLFSTHLYTSVKSVIANELSYGPGDLEISIRNLDGNVLALINKQSNNLQNGTEAERQQAMMALLPELPKLFNKGAEFEISQLNMKLPEGMVEGNLFISLPKGDNSNPFAMIQKIQGNGKLKMPKIVVKQLVLQSVAQQMSKQPDMQQALIQQMQSTQPQSATQPSPDADQLAAMQAEKQISTMEQTGLIVAQGEDYTIEFTLQDGKFTVNGKPFDQSMLK